MNIPKNWTFKTDEVAREFDGHVREQLPWYDILTDLVCMVAKHYICENAKVYDIGCSTGNLAVCLDDVIKARKVDWVGIDNSESMRAVFRASVPLVITDATVYQYQPFDLAICFLSLMFFPPKIRRKWLDELFAKANKGGAIIIVDKQESDFGYLSSAIYRNLMENKMNNGATAENILQKEFSLAGVQRPLPMNFFDGLNTKEIFRYGDFFCKVIEQSEH